MPSRERYLCPVCKGKIRRTQLRRHVKRLHGHAVDFCGRKGFWMIPVLSDWTGAVTPHSFVVGALEQRSWTTIGRAEKIKRWE